MVNSLLDKAMECWACHSRSYLCPQSPDNPAIRSHWIQQRETVPQHHNRSKSLSRNLSQSAEIAVVTPTRQIKLHHTSSLYLFYKQISKWLKSQAWSSSRAKIRLWEENIGELALRMVSFKLYRHSSTRHSQTKIVAKSFPLASRTCTTWVLVRFPLRDSRLIPPWKVLAQTNQIQVENYQLLTTAFRQQIAMLQALRIDSRYLQLALVTNNHPKIHQLLLPRHIYLNS